MTSKTQDAAVERIKAAAAESAKVRPSHVNQLHDRAEIAELKAELNRLRRLAEVRIAGLLEERDAAIEHNATLRRRLAAEEERRRELETLIDGARGVLFQAAKRAQQTVEK